MTSPSSARMSGPSELRTSGGAAASGMGKRWPSAGVDGRLSDGSVPARLELRHRPRDAATAEPSRARRRQPSLEMRCQSISETYYTIRISFWQLQFMYVELWKAKPASAARGGCVGTGQAL